MARLQLPERLQPLLSDQPILHLFSHGPWVVSDEQLSMIRSRLMNFINERQDPGLVVKYSYYRDETLPLAAELDGALEFLIGVAEVAQGRQRDLSALLLGKPSPSRMSRFATSLRGARRVLVGDPVRARLCSKPPALTGRCGSAHSSYRGPA